MVLGPFWLLVFKMISLSDYINEKPVFYPLGNFVFDQPWGEDTKKGLVVRLIYQANKLSSVERLPIYMKDFAQPE
jgi:poly-gamma-glutamate capsule biosynthesis protein CapA/YwtB (metallophosphatase superfamily)